MKRYKDSLKANLKNCNIDDESWEAYAKNRYLLWRAMWYKVTASFDTDRRGADLEQREELLGRINNSRQFLLSTISKNMFSLPKNLLSFN